jgi:endonuclease III
VKDAVKSTKQFTTLMKRLGPVEPPDFADTDDPFAVLVHSFLLWESTTDKALTAYNALQRHVVDFNDLRVCMPQEILELIGVRYPRGLDRCQRLRATLRDVYSREHVVSLNGIDKLGKREIRRYIESLEGMVPYVAARVLLLSFQVHAIPVDDQLRTNLIQA